MEILSQGLPSGSIIPYAGTTEPAGFMLCNGRPLSRAAYPSLFNAIGTAYGIPDANTFRIPDFRGAFLRGVDGGFGRDPDRASRIASNPGGNTGDSVGSLQTDSFRSHTHIQDAHNHNIADAPLAGTGGGSGMRYGVSNSLPTTSTTATNQNTGGSETRPLNINVNFLIKV
jgi:microcystin-dependent protein